MCSLCVCLQYGTRHETPYMRVHVCGSCAEMLEESAENFCFNDSGILSIRILTFWSFIAKTFSIQQSCYFFPLSFSFPLYLCALPLSHLHLVCQVHEICSDFTVPKSVVKIIIIKKDVLEQVLTSSMLNKADQVNIYSLSDKIPVLNLQRAKVSWELLLKIPLL